MSQGFTWYFLNLFFNLRHPSSVCGASKRYMLRTCVRCAAACWDSWPEWSPRCRSAWSGTRLWWWTARRTPASSGCTCNIIVTVSQTNNPFKRMRLREGGSNNKQTIIQTMTTVPVTWNTNRHGSRSSYRCCSTPAGPYPQLGECAVGPVQRLSLIHIWRCRRWP